MKKQGEKILNMIHPTMSALEEKLQSPAIMHVPNILLLEARAQWQKLQAFKVISDKAISAEDPELALPSAVEIKAVEKEARKTFSLLVQQIDFVERLQQPSEPAP